MKNVIIKILAVLLTVWYPMGVIGFDVHTCSGSDRSFVVTFVEGMTCEDIHPDHVCKASCCGDGHDSCGCHHDSGCSVKAKSCCSNDYQVLALTGTVSQNNDHEHFDECSCGHCPCVGFPAGEVHAVAHVNKFISYCDGSGSGVGSACDRQAALRVWRI